MPQPHHSARRFRFGLFEADLGARELSKQGKLLPLQEQPFQLLVMLLEKPGALVTREELRARLWPQTVVDFDHGLNKAVSKIRDTLGDSAENPRFIQTVARRGYRFLAEVHEVGTEPAAPAEIPAADRASDGGSAPARSRARHMGLWILGAVALLLLSAVGIWIRATSGAALPLIRSLAVLPLENLSGDAAQDYFADGMTDELITHLAQIRDLRVISRSSMMFYRHTRKPLVEIGRELDVQAVVEGSILRSGDRVRITAQLIRVPADQHIWAHSYEGDIRDTLVLQNQVARAIADQIRVTVGNEGHAGSPKTVNAEAYDSYLKGRYYWNKRTDEGLKQAIDYFKRSISIDPSNAEAYSGLADTYALAGDWEYGILPPAEAFPLARAAANEALALNDRLGEAHTSLAFVLDLYYWDWAAAEKQYQLAINLNPGYAVAHHWYAWHLLVLGKKAEGMFEIRKAENLDPLSLIIRSDVADALSALHLFDESIQQSRKTLALDPNFAVGHFQLAEALVQQHQYDAAIAEFQQAIALSGHLAAFDANLAHAYAVSGQKSEALKIAKRMETGPNLNPSANASIALIYVGLGDLDQAMAWLNKAYDARFNPSILVRPAFDPLRSDPRFQDLRRRIGLPDYP
ncbi:MAG TPA: winged helix-turn-helix domain-containing protein [Steroidobacteraceae bacterium]|jgi:TolB-like protein/DNA-binding winged helix-turn-helix (wHTH) protein/Flp pilus assembly protein TadD|nr:winged helix-turn-helix domain-containing protein [Steroidobacteraceae bacterium]